MWDLQKWGCFQPSEVWRVCSQMLRKCDAGPGLPWVARSCSPLRLAHPSGQLSLHAHSAACLCRKADTEVCCLWNRWILPIFKLTIEWCYPSFYTNGCCTEAACSFSTVPKLPAYLAAQFALLSIPAPSQVTAICTLAYSLLAKWLWVATATDVLGTHLVNETQSVCSHLWASGFQQEWLHKACGPTTYLWVHHGRSLSVLPVWRYRAALVAPSGLWLHPVNVWSV